MPATKSSPNNLKILSDATGNSRVQLVKFIYFFRIPKLHALRSLTLDLVISKSFSSVRNFAANAHNRHGFREEVPKIASK
jgi:hypothetical protein